MAENTLNFLAFLLCCGVIVVAIYLYRKVKPTVAAKIAVVEAVEADVKKLL
jgi:hypothetical protein